MPAPVMDQTRSVAYECYGGPADGLMLLFSQSAPPPTPLVYITLPIRENAMSVYFAEPRAPFAKYHLQHPRLDKAKWVP